MANTTINEPLEARAKTLKLYGLLAHWQQIAQCDWLEPLIEWEEQERARRSLERRLGNARLGRRGRQRHSHRTQRRGQIHPRAQHRPSGRARRPHRALHQRRTHAQRTRRCRRRPNRYRPTNAAACRPTHPLWTDARGPASLFRQPIAFPELDIRFHINTTNRPFSEWGEVFPNASCVVSLVDRLVHNAEIIPIEGESYRRKEAKERSEQRRKQRAARKTKPRTEA